jgi:hypothetical protein
MKRRRSLLLVAALGIMAAVAAIGQQQKPPAGSLLVLDWASKAARETPPLAILIEMGTKDAQPKLWSGKATVSGAKVVHREGYRFWPKEDMLIEPDAWQASSHRPLRLPKAQPALAAIEGMATVGIVLHLADVQATASLSLSVKEQEIDKLVVPLKDVLAGQTKTVADGRVTVRLLTTTSTLVSDKNENDFPAAAYGPDGTLWVSYIAYTVKEESRRVEAPSLKEQPKDFKAYYTPEFGDQLFVKYYKAGKWSEPIAITEPNQDLMRCAVAVEGNGDVWVAYSANRNGKHNIYARSIANGAAIPRVGVEQQLPSSAGPALSPVMATGKSGELHLAFQHWKETETALLAMVHCKQGKWADSAGQSAIGRKANNWNPAVACGPQGEVAVAHDAYEGDSDVWVHVDEGGPNPRAFPIAMTPRFEARPSICYDAKGRLWIAYEEGPEMWGKDFGAVEKNPGNPLYASRSVRVVCLDHGKLMKPIAELPTASGPPPRYPFEMVPAGPGGAIVSGPTFERQPRYAYPQIGIDGKGRVWLTYRAKFGSRYSSHPGSYWLTFARRLDDDHWTEPIEIHHSDGLLDNRPALLPHPSGGLRIVHNGDARYTEPENVTNRIFHSYVDLPGDPLEPKLVVHDPGQKDPRLAELDAAVVKRIRDYRMTAGGKKYQLQRGEFHRHTEISWDGGPDGSLEDMWRYGIDAVAFDWIGNGDHDNGAGREYSWWLIQKTTDAYHVKDRFTPMFTYERSVSYPHGHRNCVFPRRGVRTLPRLAETDKMKVVGGVHADDTKMLYRYLHELDGICAIHTSATSMGTDWRDNDPVVEPLVEIYQGDRMSYEMENAPRAGYDPKDKKAPANIAGWFPKGFVNLALQKGHRLGFQASSDHWSTHCSYCIVLAERHDRAGIFDAMKKRHAYGATDDIILDVQSGPYIMGDEFKSKEAPALQIRVIGTRPLANVVILKDSEPVHTFQPGKPEFEAKWTDPKPVAGVHYYYVRVEQTGGELAWGSPMWIEYVK